MGIRCLNSCCYTYMWIQPLACRSPPTDPGKPQLLVPSAHLNYNTVEIEGRSLRNAVWQEALFIPLNIDSRGFSSLTTKRVQKHTILDMVTLLSSQVASQTTSCLYGDAQFSPTVLIRVSILSSVFSVQSPSVSPGATVSNLADELKCCCLLDKNPTACQHQWHLATIGASEDRLHSSFEFAQRAVISGLIH